MGAKIFLASETVSLSYRMQILLRIWLCINITIFPSTEKTIQTIRLPKHNKAMNNPGRHASL